MLEKNIGTDINKNMTSTNPRHEAMKTYIGTTTIHFNKNVKKTTKICAS
jgi:hypothetical protein